MSEGKSTAPSVYRRHLRRGQKGSSVVGETKRGEGTRIMAIADRAGLPVAACISSASPAEVALGDDTLDSGFLEVEPEIMIGDKAYDAQTIIEFIKTQGSNPVIPPKKNRIEQREYDKHLYKERHLVECFFCKLKEFRRIATRYEKLSVTYLAMVTIASCLIWLR